MLKYFTMTVDALVICAVLVGLLRGYTALCCGKAGRIIAGCGAGLGLILAGTMSYMKNLTTKIDTSMWNYRIFIFALSVLGAFVILALVKRLVPVFGKQGKAAAAGNIVLSVTAGLLIAALMLYALPDVLAYPYTILLTDQTALSTDYLFKIIGIIFGVILMLLLEMAAIRGVQRLGHWQAFTVTVLALVVNGLRQAAGIIRIMFNKRMILPIDKHYDDYFEIIRFSSNNDIWFVYGVLAVLAAVPVIIWIKSFIAKEPYSNPAEKRKIRKKWIVSRRWANLAVCCIAMMLLSILVIEPYTNRPVELSPVEETTVDGDNIIVSFDQVDDGHLHRFGYTTPAGKHTRFIVIQKPGSSGYGLGLDACDICGETGYYERDGQVVCKLCDVVMNINTIGFPGGCNPIVIEYSIQDGKIIVPVRELIEHENVFKS